MSLIIEECEKIESAPNWRAAFERQLSINKLLMARIDLIEHQINILAGADGGIVREIRGSSKKWRQPIWRERG